MSLSLLPDATAYIARQRLAVSAYQERNKYGDNFDDNASVNSQATSNTVRGGTSRYVPPSEGLPCKCHGLFVFDIMTFVDNYLI